MIFKMLEGIVIERGCFQPMIPMIFVRFHDHSGSFALNCTPILNTKVLKSRNSVLEPFGFILRLIGCRWRLLKREVAVGCGIQACKNKHKSFSNLCSLLGRFWYKCDINKKLLIKLYEGCLSCFKIREQKQIWIIKNHFRKFQNILQLDLHTNCQKTFSHSDYGISITFVLSAPIISSSVATLSPLSRLIFYVRL